MVFQELVLACREVSMSLTGRGGAPVLEVLQYHVDALSGWSKPLFHLPAPKIHLIYGPRVGDISDIKLIAKRREAMPTNSPPWRSGSKTSRSH